MELGLHIANFTWPGGAPQLAPTLARIATTTEDAGFTAITVMDHLWQIGVVGPPARLGAPPELTRVVLGAG